MCVLSYAHIFLLIYSKVPKLNHYWIEANRSEAIHRTIALAHPGDVVLIAGKGHEKTQEIKGIFYPFDDLQQAHSALELKIACTSEWVCTAQIDSQNQITKARGIHQSFMGIEIDTRRLNEAQLFVCLQGQTDGHRFIPQAIEKGCKVILGKPFSSLDSTLQDLLITHSITYLETIDPQAVLGPLASLYRQAFFRGKLVGLTGSNGKTSTKEFLAILLSSLGPTHSTQGNFNNHLGVPLTLFSLRPVHHYSVVLRLHQFLH